MILWTIWLYMELVGFLYFSRYNVWFIVTVNCFVFVCFCPLRLLEWQITHLSVHITFVTSMMRLEHESLTPILDTPIREGCELFTRHKFRHIVYDGNKIAEDFRVIVMESFDLILRMDYLARYHAMVDCYIKGWFCFLKMERWLFTGWIWT